MDSQATASDGRIKLFILPKDSGPPLKARVNRQLYRRIYDFCSLGVGRINRFILPKDSRRAPQALAG